MINQIVLFTTMVAFTLARYMPNNFHQQGVQCEPLNNQMCKDLDPENYLYTSFPNYMNHSSADIANEELAKYKPFIDTQCSNALKPFLCMLFLPTCKPGLISKVPPCRSVCEEARRGCEPMLNSANIKWPSVLNCARFPDENTGLCVGLPDPQPKDDKKIVPEIENHIPSKRTHMFKKPGHHAIAMKELTPMQEVELQCDSDKMILIKKVRHWSDDDKSQCNPQKSMCKMSKKCHGKASCTVILDASIVGEDCVKTMKKTAVRYKCVKKYQSERKTPTSEPCEKEEASMRL